MDVCSLAFKDRGAKKCMVGIGIFIVIALAILYFTTRSDDKPACLSTQKFFNLIDSGWQNSPKNVFVCNYTDSDSVTEGEISELGFTNVIMYSTCDAIKMECDGGTKEIKIKCPFRVYGLNFVINGTNSTSCEDPLWFNLNFDITNETLDSRISLSTPYTFKIRPDCSYLKNYDDTRTKNGVIINHFSSILTNMFNHGLRKSLNIINEDQNITGTKYLNMTKYCDVNGVIGVTDQIVGFDLDLD